MCIIMYNIAYVYYNVSLVFNTFIYFSYRYSYFSEKKKKLKPTIVGYSVE
jgi:hypothetical protein